MIKASKQQGTFVISWQVRKVDYEVEHFEMGGAKEK